MFRGIKYADPLVRLQKREQWRSLEVCDYDLRTQTQFFTGTADVVDVIEEILEYLDPSPGEASAAAKALHKFRPAVSEP